MNKLIIASHSTLAEGMLKAAKLITGETNNVSYISAYESNDVDYNKLIYETVSSFDYESGNLIIATDLMGGSVNNQFLQYLKTYPFHLIAGVNLVTVMSLILQLDSLDAEHIREIIESSKNTIVYCNDISIEEPDNNEF